MDTKQLYMYALMPSDELRMQLEIERDRFSKRYNTIKALKNPIHITLIPPFHFQESEEHELVERIEPTAVTPEDFEVLLNGYGSFLSNGVFFIHVELDDTLEKFQAALRSMFHEAFPEVSFRAFGEFKPHITLGYRDLEQSMLRKAIADYQDRTFKAKWPVNGFYLWKLVNHRWVVQHRFGLGKN